MSENGLVTAPSSHPFGETVRRLESSLDRRGLMTFARIDHAAGAKAEGLDLPPTLLMVFGAAKAGTPVMQARRSAGLDLPLKILVWEDEDAAAWLTYSEVEWIANRHGVLTDEDDTAVSALQHALQSLVGEVAGEARLSPLLESAAACHDRGNGKLQVQVAVGGVSFPADEPETKGGGCATGPSPHDLLAAALAARTTLTLRLYADHKQWPLERIHVAVEHVREDGATPADLFRRKLELSGPLDLEQRQRLVEIADRCPVHRTLTAGSRIETTTVTEETSVLPAS